MLSKRLYLWMNFFMYSDCL